MSQEVKTEGNASDPQAVNTTGAAPATTSSEGFDFPKEYNELLAKAAQTQVERDNYKNMALKWKNKANGSATDEDDEIESKVQERLTLEKEAQIQKEKDALLAKAMRENTELKNALKNKPTTTTTGNSSDGPKVESQIISPDMMNYFRNTLKWDDAKIELYKKNYNQLYGR